MRNSRVNLISCLTLIALLASLVGCGDDGTTQVSDGQSSDATGDASNGGDGNNNADGSKDGDGQDGIDGASTPCDDQNSCTIDVMNPDGSCSHSQKGDGEACDDSNKCTTGDLCISAMCIGSGQTYCSDGNDCTTDLCDPLQPGDGCKHVNNPLPCDDSDACTTGDICTAGACLPGSSKKDCDDKDACTTDTCDSTTGCVHKKVECNDQNECTTDMCDPANGKCQFVNNAKACEDGDMCKSGDKCSGGTCISGTVPKTCNDLNDCTTDSCDPTSGCMNAVKAGATCNDGDPTTKTDACGADGVCAGVKPLTPCDDNNACTDDAGDPASGVKCTYTTVNCDDQNGCTKDSCDKANGCVHQDTQGICNDGDACTVGDKCSAGVCVGGVAPVCNDNNPCTSDTCDPTSGCVFSPLAGVACDDGNICTINDQCSAVGTCESGATVDCEDGNVCTADSCSPAAGGCVHAALSGAVCDDGNSGTVEDTCQSGKCKGNSIACDDNNACTFDTGSGPPNCTHSSLVCDDGNPCTTDSCDPTKGCAFVNNTAACDDGNACTVGEVCSAGTCSNGTGLKCDDGDSCTTDACDKTGTCSHTTIVGCGFGEICGNGVDDDGDGKIDCSDSECGLDKTAYRLEMYAQYGGMAYLVTANASTQIFQITLPPDGPGGIQKPQYVEVFCGELPFAVKMESSGQLVGLLKAFVVGPDMTPATAPLSWYFDVVTNAPLKPTLGALPNVKKVNSYSSPKGNAFQVSWPPSK